MEDKIIIITGGNSGIGYEAAKYFAQKNGSVILACRDMVKAEKAKEEIMTAAPWAQVDIMKLDLASLSSIRSFSVEFHKKYNELHILCNNAGVMAIPYLTTEDGFEMQFGTNHLGHFALTGLLIDLLLKTKGSRVVTTSSGQHTSGKINFEDLNEKENYNKWAAYSQSKLANLLFAYELQRRMEGKLISVACNPAFTETNLQYVGPELEGSVFLEVIMTVATKLLAHSVETGTRPLIYAATSPDIKGGEYIAPSGPWGLWGEPKRIETSKESHDLNVAKRLWEVSEKLTNVHF